MKLEDKVAIITGAASGIGRATARLFGQEGAALSISDIDMEGLEKVAAELRGGGTRVLASRADISNREEVNEMVEKTLAEFGRVDVLVNNAGHVYFHGRYFYKSDPEEWEPHINITLRGTLYVTRAVVPHMIEQKSGRVINISSDSGKHPMPGFSLYGAVKAGIAAFSRCLAIELAPYGILVNCISPGSIKTKLVKAMTIPRGEAEKIFAQIPLARMGEPNDIASMVLHLASDAGKYITGQNYSIDGGMTMC
jgi:NAD(P)-dependent dehydrogenase (short-subunit alcohol dehydrogenase family)